MTRRSREKRQVTAARWGGGTVGEEVGQGTKDGENENTENESRQMLQPHRPAHKGSLFFFKRR